MTKKKCSTCKEEKMLSEFNFRDKSKGVYRYACKICTRKEYKTHYNSNKKAIIQQVYERQKKMARRIQEYKAQKGCKLCKENHSSCLEFHHIEKNKEFNLGDVRTKGYSWERVKREINKCVVICSNCHKKIHAGALSL